MILIAPAQIALQDIHQENSGTSSSRNAPSEDVGPRIPGTFDRTEEES